MTHPAGCRRSPWSAVLVVVLAVAGVIAIAGCSDPDRTAEAFCERLADATGPAGGEVTLISGDPGRVPAVLDELHSLLDRAPDDIATTIRTLTEFFETYQRSPRNERRELLRENEVTLALASAELDDYALRECGLFLQRAIPTPIETSDPGIDVAPE